nr:putative transposase (putative), gypsy type [Tanacetum cinerariifolium]
MMGRGGPTTLPPTSQSTIQNDLHPELPGLEERIVDFPKDSLKNWNNRFFWVDERVFPTAVDWHTNVSKDEMPAANTYSRADVAVLNTRRTPIQKQPETLLCLVGLSRRYFLGDDVYPTFLHDNDRDMDLFNLISAPNPSKVKTGLRPRVAHEVPLLTATTRWVIDMEDPDVATESSGTPSAIKKSSLNFDNENQSPPMTEEVSLEEEVAAMGPRLSKKHHIRENDGADANAPPKVLRKDYASVRPEQRTRGGKIVSTIGLAVDSTFVTPADTKGVSDPDPLSYAKPQPHPEQSMTEIQVREEKIKKLDQEVQGLQNQTSNLKTLLEAEADMKKNAEAKNADLTKELERLRIQFLDLQVSNDQLTQQVSTLQTQVTGEERIRAAFEEFKKYEDDMVEKRCTEMDACPDALSINFDEELYPHMLTAIAGRRWVIGHGLRLAIIKCAKSIELRQAFANVVSAGIAKGMSEGLAHGIEHGKADQDLEVLEAYDPEANIKYLQALQELKDLKYPIVDQLKGLKDALIEKKRCRVVCCTHEVGFAHHARSYGVPISVPTVAPQGLVILLANAATQRETSEDDASPRLLRSKSLLPMYNLD